MMYNKSNGYTLVELIVTIAIVGIILAIAVTKLTGFKSMTENRICAANRKTVESMYNSFLLENNITDASVFDQFIKENFILVCPAGGTIIYEDGYVKCSLHSDGVEKDNEPLDEEAPWL